jgi:hypothetical protein
MLMDVEMMTNTGLEFMRMIIHPWLSEQHTLPIHLLHSYRLILFITFYSWYSYFACVEA